MTGRPFDDLTKSTNKRVLVKLKGDKTVSGVLKSYDVHLNLVLEEAEIILADESKSKHEKILVRGDNILFVAL